ncbi:tail protein [Lactobacillus phage Bassarid]|nr:tail protein [Lactobacillus phage Bassarid]
MAIRTYDILLDSYNSTIPEPIVGRQGDKNGAVTLHVTITDRGTAVDLTGQTVNLIAETANGTAVVADNAGVTLTDAANGKFDYAIPNALWSEAGKITKAYFSLNDTDGQQTTYDLIFMVKAAVDVTQEKADDYITVIDGTIRDLKTKIDEVYQEYQAGAFYSKNDVDGFLSTINNNVELKADKKEVSVIQTPFNDIGEFPSNLKSQIDSFIDSLDPSKFRILWLSDSHYEELLDPNVVGSYPYGGMYALNHAAIADYISNNVDVVIAGGDNTNGIDNDVKHSISDASLYASRLLSSSSDSDKFIMIGNHDDGSPINAQGVTVKPSMVLTNEQFEQAFSTHELQFGETRNDGSLYFYKDYPNSKVRIVGLNSLDVPYQTANSDGSSKYMRWIDYGFGQEQLNWLINDAMVVPSGYSTVFATHVPLVHGYSPIAKVTYYNYDLLENLINAFATGGSYNASSKSGTPSDLTVSVSADFTKQGARSVAGFYGGHVHSESLSALDHFTQFIFLADVNAEPANIGTINELGMSVIEIDPTAKTVTIKGLGRATDRSYSYV